MQVITEVLGFIILSISIVGYILYAKECLKVPIECCFIFVFSCVGILVFLAGLVNLLMPVTYLIFITGIILSVYFVKQGNLKKLINLHNITLINVAFVGGFIAVFTLLLTTKFIHYDNFSHWGIAVKYMLNMDAFPDASATLIDFLDYPLGTTSWIYYVCKIAGNSQGMMLIAQALIIFACFYAMFGVITEKKRMLLYAILGFGYALMTIFNISVRINNLMVDFVLPVLALAAIAVIYINRKNIKMACIQSIPILGFLTVVKNTGIIFAVLCCIYLIYMIYTGRKSNGNIGKKQVILIGASFLISVIIPLIAWRIHVTHEFAGISTKFQITSENILNVFSGKSVEQIQGIIIEFRNMAFNLFSLSTGGIVLFNIVAIGSGLVAWLVIGKKWKVIKVAILMNIVTILYYLGTLAMYIFIMPLDEAIRLAGVERYTSSIVIFFLGCILFTLVIDVENSFYIRQGNVYNYRAFKSVRSKTIYQRTTVLLFVLAVVCLVSELNGMNATKRLYKGSLPDKLEQLIGETEPKDNVDNSHYLIYATDEDEQIANGYLKYVARYMLYTQNIDAIAEVTEELMSMMKNYDYFIILESDREISQFMNNYFGLEGSEGVYNIKDIFG